MVISSLDNKKIKFINSLKINRKRKEHQCFVVEGMHLIYEAYKNDLLQEIFLLENEKLDFECNLEVTYVTYEVMQKITNLNTSTNVLGICKIKSNNEIFGNRILVLDDIQDPGNLGTIIRSASAFSVDTLVLSENTVDLYNDKVIRSTQGMLFGLNIVKGNIENIIFNLKDDGYIILGTDVVKGIDVRKNKFKKFVLVVGNEGNGVSNKIKELCDHNLYIKMNKDCESLNVAVATSILLYELGIEYE